MLPYLRQRPQSTKLWLSIYSPPTILACQVNDATIAVGEETITYNNVTAGGFAGVRSGMTMLVGSTPGGRDRGRIRVKSADATTITIAENSEIEWEDDLYLTVLDYWEIWSVFPFYTLVGETVTFYKDKDIAYSGQNADAGLGSIVCMGSHYAGFVGDQVYYTSTGTVPVSDQTPLSYTWYFGGSTSTGSNQAHPGYVQYNTPGHYTTVLVVETSQGVQDIGYRHVSIYDRPGSGTSTPILQWELEELAGSRDEGGYSAKFRVHEDVSDVVDGALVVLFADDSYGTDYISVGGNSENRSSIVYVGYIKDGSIEYDYHDSIVTFEVVSSSQIMKEQTGLSVSVDSVDTPSDWYELEDIDVQKALYHYYRWHSTLLLTTDFRYVGTDYPFQYFDTESASLYDAMSSFLKNSLLGYLVSDRQNNLWAEVGPETYDDLSTIPYDIDILRQDWVNEPEITYRPNKQVAYLELSGVGWSGVATGTWSEYIAASPGSSLAYYGDMDSQTGLILVDQSNLNILVGNVYAYRNAIYPDITMQIAGNYRNFDVAPLKRELLTVYPDDTIKGIQFTQKPFHITEIEWSYDPTGQTFLPVINLYELTQGYPGVTIEKPQTPIVNFPDLPPLPPFPIVPLPTPNPIPPPIVPAPPPNTDPDCVTNDNAPANGPYNLHVSGVIQSNASNTDTTAWTFGMYFRRKTAANLTGIIIDGYWQKSDDGGATWSDWVDNYHWGVRSSGVGSHDATPASDPWPSGRGQRTLYFDDYDVAEAPGGVDIWVSKTGDSDAFYQPSGSSAPYWLLGPLDLDQDDITASAQNHTGTVTVPSYGGVGQGVWMVWRIGQSMTDADEKGIKPNSTSHVPSIWGAGSPDTNLQANQWYFWDNPSPLTGNGTVDDVIPNLITGSSMLTGSYALATWADWSSGNSFKGYLIAETFPAKVFNFEPAYFYMVMYDGGPTIYRMTIYSVSIFNICYAPNVGNGGYE